MTNLAILILAAGKGKRMGNPDLPKVMALLNNKQLLSYVLDQAAVLQATRTIVIVGHQRQLVQDFLSSHYPDVEYAVQAEQLGTGHAVLQCAELLQDFHGEVLILSGDVPLLSAATLSDFISDHLASSSHVSVLSCIAPDPTGYGRIVRDAHGKFESIVEHRDATEAQREVAEINSGIYVVNSDLLFSSLNKVQNTNAQQEYYLTDVIGILHREGYKVSAFSSSDFQELMGINTSAELQEAERILLSRAENT